MRKSLKNVIAVTLALAMTITPVPAIGTDKQVNAYSVDGIFVDNGPDAHDVNTVISQAQTPTDIPADRIGARMPYYRYDTEIRTYVYPNSGIDITYGDNAQYGETYNDRAVSYQSESEINLTNGANIVYDTYAGLDDAIAYQASARSYVDLPNAGSSVEWTVEKNHGGDGVTMRFTMPDSTNGRGVTGKLYVEVSRNGGEFTQENVIQYGVVTDHIPMSSYWMWQYFDGSTLADKTAEGAIGCFAFDEVHFQLAGGDLKGGDKIRIVNKDGDYDYGVDFLEIEKVPEMILPEAGDTIVSGNDMAALNEAIATAKNTAAKSVYIPAGEISLNNIWKIATDNNGLRIRGAGMWYTKLQFTQQYKQRGGISGDKAVNVEFSDVYINSRLRSRYNENAIHKCFMDVWTNCRIHDVWEDHFECGMWLASYAGTPSYCDGIQIYNCRLRNNLADGVNFCQGTSNAVVYNCSIRNNGDDGLAMWNNNANSAKDESNNIFAYNTIDLTWRAGGIAIYGGNNHKIFNNYICESPYASGIHLNTTFSGYKFENNNDGIYFTNNALVRCGTKCDIFSKNLAAVDLSQDVKNIIFTNTEVYDSTFIGVRLTRTTSGIVFNNTTIRGVALATGTGGFAFSQGNTTSATINGLVVSNFKEGNAFNAYTANHGQTNYSAAQHNLDAYNVKGYPAAIPYPEPEEEPTTEAPTEEPTTEEPTTEEPTTEEPTTEEPTTEQPTTEQPTTEQPTTEEPETLPDTIILDEGDQGAFCGHTISSDADGWSYGGYVYLKGATSDYKYLVLTYKGSLENMRFEIVGDDIYWFDTWQANKFVDSDGNDFETNYSDEERTIVIDLERSGVALGYGEGLHIHAENLASNGGITFINGYLTKNKPEGPSEPTYNVSVDGEVVATVEEGESYTPAIADGVAAYKADGMLYKPGQSVDVYSNIDFESITLKTNTTASVLMKLVSGIRFSAVMTNASVDDPEAFGVIIGSKAAYNMAGRTMKIDTPWAYVSNANAFADDSGKYYGSVVGVGNNNYPTEYVAEAYANFIYDGNGDSNVTTCYANVSPEKSVRGLANAIKNDGYKGIPSNIRPVIDTLAQ